MMNPLWNALTLLLILTTIWLLVTHTTRLWPNQKAAQMACNLRITRRFGTILSVSSTLLLFILNQQHTNPNAQQVTTMACFLLLSVIGGLAIPHADTTLHHNSTQSP